MRIAFNSLPDSLLSQLTDLNARQSALQNQAATGRRISQLADDPAAMRRILDSQVQGSQITQYRRNIASLQDRATGSYNALQGLKRLSDRAGEIATLADGTKSPQELKTYADEINQLIQQGVQLVNSKQGGDYLFGGTRTDQPPFVAATDAGGNVTGVTYQGNQSVPATEIASGLTVTVQTPGANTSGSGPTGLVADSRNGADFFAHLIALRDHLRAGDTSSIASSDRAALAKDEDNITLHIADNGLVQSQLTTADTVAAAQANAVRDNISQDADADLATTLTQLSAARTAYQAALQSGASMLNSGQSLLDYLR